VHQCCSQARSLQCQWHTSGSGQICGGSSRWLSSDGAHASPHDVLARSSLQRSCCAAVSGWRLAAACACAVRGAPYPEDGVLCMQRVSGEHLAAAALPGCRQHGSADWLQALGPRALDWLQPAASCMMSAGMLSSPTCSWFACGCKPVSRQPCTVNSAAQRGEWDRNCDLHHLAEGSSTDSA
jgi:hypothetical protein